MSKKYDWFAANLFQPGLSTDDFYNLGLTPDNSEIKSKDSYKNLPDVISRFTNDQGEFDNKAFDDFYNTSLSRYNNYSKDEFDKKVVENYKYDPFDWMAPIGAETRDVSAKFVINQKNPTKIEMGIEGLGLTAETPFSNREIAQANEVRDENGNSLGYTPNERGGLFKSLSRPTLVLAQYDEDITEIVDGKQITHMKGELKLDEHGLPYYEELGNREIYGKDVLHWTDTFTEDGSKWNKYDFFDSDGLEKSIGGTIAKTVFEIAPYFIPYVNYVWAGINAGLEIAQLLPTLGKAVNGFISGNNENNLGVGLSKWESYLERFESSTSDYSRNKMVTTENFGNLIADISGQLWQQKAISYIPKLLEKTGLLTDTSKNIELGKNLALAYMASTSARESYGAFKEAGASDRVAGLAMIGNILALNKLMQIEYFQNSVFRNSYLDPDNIKRPAWGVAKQVMKDLGEEANNVAGQEANKKLLSKITGLFTEQLIPGLSKSEFVRASVTEGVEEVMEEAVSDFSKAFTEGLNAIGLNVTESNKELNFGWSLNDIASRYAMSFGGGMIGGALFQANNKWEMKNVPKAVRDMDEKDLSKLTYLIAQGRTNEIKAYYKKLHDKGLLGDSNLSSSKLKTTVNLDGVEETIAESAEKNESQNDFVYNALLRHIDYIENLLADEKMKVPTEVHAKMLFGQIAPKSSEDNKLLRAQVLNLALENSGFFNEFNRLANQIVQTRAELESIYNEAPAGDTDAAKKERAENFNANEKVKQLTERLNKLRARRDEILEGKWNWYYVGQGLFALDEDTNKYFLNLTKDKFSQIMYGRMYDDLTSNQKEEFERDWRDYQNTEGKRNTYRAYEIYTKLAELASPDLLNATQDLAGMNVDSIHSGKTNWDILIDKNAKLVEIQSKKKELEAKESLTSEEQEKLNELRELERNLDEEVNYLNINTDSLLRGATEGEPNNFATMYSDLDQLQIASNYIKSLYQDFINKNAVMRSEDELSTFYRLVKSNPNNSKSVKSRLDGFMSFWMDNPFLYEYSEEMPSLEFVNKDLNNMLMTEGADTSNPLQDRLVSILQDLENEIGKDYNIVQNKLQEAVDFILEHTKFNEEQALTVIKGILPHVGTNSILDTLSEIEALRSNIRFSPIYDILKRFKTTFSDGTVDVVSLINSEINRLSEAANRKEYIIGSKQVQEELKEVLRFLDAIKALINGSYSGINNAVNTLKSKSGLDGEIVLLPELDENAAKILFNDIEFIQGRIAGLLNIAANNGQKKLKIHKETEIKMKPLMLKYYMEDHFMDDFKNNLGVDIRAIWQRVNKYNINLDYIGESDWDHFEDTRLEFESELRKEILSNNSGDFTKKLINCFGENLYKQISTKIDPDTKAMSAYDMLFYTADIIQMDSKVFASRYKDILLKTPDLAPVFGQELAIRKFVTNSVDPTLYNRLLDHISALNPSTHKKPSLYNIINVFGGAGTGKTVAISSIAAQILSFDENIEFVYLAPNQNQVEKLSNSVGIKGTTYTLDDFRKEFIQTGPNYKFKEIKSENKKVITWSYSFDKSKKLWKSEKNRKVLIIDESSLVDSGTFAALSDLAKSENGIVWTLGDIKQNAAIVSVEGAKMHSGLEDFTIAKSPELTTSLRPNFLGKFENGSIFDKMLSEINREAAINGYNSLSDYDKLTNTQLGSIEVLLKYHETSDGTLYGEKFISSDQLSFYINRLKNKNVALITDKDVSVDGIEVIKPEKAQGGEWDYVIIDKPWSSSRYDKLRDLYTLTQRSTIGTIIVDNGIAVDLNVKKIDTPTAAEPMTLENKDKQEFIDWKVNSIPTSAITSEFIRMFDSVSETPPIVKDEEEFEETIEEKTGEEMEEKVSKEIPEETGAPANTFVLDPIITPKNVISDSIVQKPNPESKDLNIQTEGIPTDEESFFNMIYNLDVWRARKNKNIGLFSITKNLTPEIAIEIADIVSSSIKENNPKQIETLLETLVINNKIDRDNYKKLKDFFKKSQMELHIIPDNNRSTMIARFTDFGSKDRTTIEIPITVLPGTLSGKYNGDFVRISQPKYTKGEWIALSALKQKYPWLKIFNTWQVLSVDTDQIENSEIFSEETKDYLLGKKDDEGNRKQRGNNSGNVFTLATDSSYIAQTWDNNRVYSLDDDPKYPGKKYTHQASDKVTNFGLNRFISPADIIRYSLLLYYKDMKSKGIPIETPNLGIEDFDTWMKEISGMDVLPNSNFYKREYQIISQSQCVRFLDVLFREALNNSYITRLIQNSLHVAMVKDDKSNKNGKLYKTGLSFNNDDGGYYVEYQINDNLYHVYEYNNGFIGKEIRTIDLIGGKLRLKDLNSIFGSIKNISMINREFDNWIQTHVYNKFVFNQVVDVLGAVDDIRIYDILNDVLKTTDEFKYGAFSNVHGAFNLNPFYANGVSRKFVGKSDGYATNASTWIPSVFSIDTSKIIDPENEKIENDRITFETQLDEIKSLISPLLNVDEIWKTIDTKRVQNYEESLNNLINYVNNLLLKSANDWSFSQLLSEDGKFILNKTSDFNRWLNTKFGITGDINFDHDYLNNFKFGIFSVSLSNNYAIWHDGKQWKVLDSIKTYNELRSLLDLYESNPIFKQLIPNFINYIKMTIDGSINSDVNSIIEMFQNPMLDELTESLVDYLDARIQKEEC